MKITRLKNKLVKKTKRKMEKVTHKKEIIA